MNQKNIFNLMLIVIDNTIAMILFGVTIIIAFIVYRRESQYPAELYDHENDFDSDSETEDQCEQNCNQDCNQICAACQDLHRRRFLVRRSERLAHLYQLNYPYVLIIIDMQDQFSTSRNETIIKNIQRLISEAMQDGAFIIAAHYMRCGRTRPELLGMFQNYVHRAFCYADNDDKSGSIQTKMIGLNIRTNVFKICGVNTGACVQQTVMGLASFYPSTHIMISGSVCNCYCNEYPMCDGHNIGRFPNVSFVY